jgi:hypothetical protein
MTDPARSNSAGLHVVESRQHFSIGSEKSVANFVLHFSCNRTYRWKTPLYYRATQFQPKVVASAFFKPPAGEQAKDLRYAPAADFTEVTRQA